MTFLLKRLSAVVLLAGAATLAQANGQIDEHVNNLQAHIEDYTVELRGFLAEADKIVEQYGEKSADVKPEQLAEKWETLKFHAAIETTFVPVYASIWQGIFGVHDAIKQGKPMAEVRQQQGALEAAMWQGLGAVKLAAKHQSEQPAAAAGLATDPVTTLAEIKDDLDRAVAKYAERDLETATSLVHSTYANRFEGVEGPLIQHDAALVEDLEKDFNVTLPRQLQAGTASIQEVRAVVAEMKRKLDRAQSLLRDAAEHSRSVF